MNSVITFILVAAALAYSLLILSVILDDYIMGLISSMAILCVGIYIAIYNVGSINNLLTQFLAVISIGIGAFIFIDTSRIKIEELM